MKLKLIILIVCLLSQSAHANELPDLGDISQSSFSVRDEERIGSEIMRDVYADSQYYDDAELTEYLNNLGAKLVAVSSESQRSFQFFVLRNNTLNAFALPGGYIGVHTGLIEAAQSESELAGVLGHEIAHVTQHHLARMVENQNKGILPSIAALAVAILAARSNPQVAGGALAAVQAASIQKQLNFSRDNEREADRIGIQIMSSAGFNPNAMASFFERLQKYSRFYESNAPAYLRTHPLTFERIADMQNRAANLRYKQVANSLEFNLLRVKIHVTSTSSPNIIAELNDALQDHSSNQISTLYGLSLAYMQAQQYDAAEKTYRKLIQSGAKNPVIDGLGARIKLSSGDLEGALQRYREARSHYPNYRPLVYSYADALLRAGQTDNAVKLITGFLTIFPNDFRLYQLQSRAYAQSGKDFLRHYSQAEAYAQQGNLTAAIEQLQIALKTHDGDFYQMSIAEARLKQLIIQNKNDKQAS